MVAENAAAFLSYARFDDVHDDRQISAFRERLAAEVRMQTGEEFVIFQDRTDIAWGQNWQRRIEQELDGVTLLLVVLTPGFFGSEACRGEVERFAERERMLGRDDLILPLYYVRVPELYDPARRDADPVARLLAARQYVDWQELRFEPLTTPLARKAIAQIASRIKDTFWHLPTTPQAPMRVHESVAAAGPQAQGTAGHVARRHVTAKPEPPTHVVDAYQRGDFAMVGEAVRAARPGDRILVRPGLYEEGLVIDKPLEILGDGPVADIVIRARGADAISFRASIGRVANLTLWQAGGKGTWYGVDICQGRLDLDGCDISSKSLACVAIRDGAHPRLHRNTIHDGKESGVMVYDGGLGTLEDNDITANGLSGVEIGSGGNPTLRRNTVHDNNQSGIHVYAGGLGTLEDNDITANGLAGVNIKTGGNPTVRRNTIHRNKQDGVYVYDKGLGTLEDNDITANTSAGVAIRAGGNPTLRGNRINRNGTQAVRIYEDGRGLLMDNDLTGNKRGAWNIAAESKTNVTHARNRD